MILRTWKPDKTRSIWKTSFGLESQTPHKWGPSTQNFFAKALLSSVSVHLSKFFLPVRLKESDQDGVLMAILVTSNKEQTRGKASNSDVLSIFFPANSMYTDNRPRKATWFFQSDWQVWNIYPIGFLQLSYCKHLGSFGELEMFALSHLQQQSKHQ